MGRGSRRNAEEVVRAMAPAPLRRRPSRRSRRIWANITIAVIGATGGSPSTSRIVFRYANTSKKTAEGSSTHTASAAAAQSASIPRLFEAAAGGAATVCTGAAAVSPKAGGVTGAAAVSLKAGFVVAVD